MVVVADLRLTRENVGRARVFRGMAKELGLDDESDDDDDAR